MQPFHKQSGTAKAVEVLYFDQAEVHKVKDDATSFSSVGPLSVLYFKDYHRFVLQLNDWKYPLVRRLPVIVDPDHSDMSCRHYVLPGANGFCFNLRIAHVPTSQGLTNLETIFSSSSHFSFGGQMFAPPRELDASPDDKLSRPLRSKDSGAKEVIGATAKTIIEKVKVGVATIKTGTVHLTSTKRKLNPKDIKNKNFWETARPTFKKDFFESSRKATLDFQRARFENKNLFEVKEFGTLQKTSESSAAVMFVNKEEIEDAILNNKDIVSMTEEIVETERVEDVSEGEKTGMMQRVKEGMRDIKDSLITSTRVREAAPRVMKTQETEGKKVVELEGLSHYQG